ncbi:sodium:proton exchanger [Lysinibacillus sp. NPDC093688]|uniref:sodium:proton exchanger n=1 Tax=Lysinibacillus sp. NPDC093688 TaxID=3390577 RepID=UPI003D01565D
MMESCCNCDCTKNVIRLNKVSSCPICRGNFVQPSVPNTFTTGAIWRNPATETIIVTLLNKTDAPQTVTVSVLDWQNCAQEEMPKDAFLCGESQSSLFDGTATPLTFTIPAKQLLTVHATPQNAWQPVDPCYEVLVTLPPVPIIPTNPFTPTDPVTPGDPCIVNTWGINNLGIPQEGNTVLHRQFQRTIFI